MIIKVIKKDGSGCTCNCTQSGCYDAEPVPCGCINCLTGEIGVCDGATGPTHPEPCDALVITLCPTNCAREISNIECSGQLYTKYADIHGVVSYTPADCTTFQQGDEVFLKSPGKYTTSINEAANTYWVPEEPPIICNPIDPCDSVTLDPCDGEDCSVAVTLDCADGTSLSYTIDIAGYVAAPVPVGCSLTPGTPVPSHTWEPPDTSCCLQPCSCAVWEECEGPDFCGIVDSGATACNGISYAWSDVATLRVKQVPPGCNSLSVGQLDTDSVIRVYNPELPDCCIIGWVLDDPCACVVTEDCTVCAASGATMCKGLEYTWTETWSQTIKTVPVGCTKYEIGKPAIDIDPSYSKTWDPEEPPCGAIGPIPESCYQGCYGIGESGELEPKTCAFVCCEERLKVSSKNCLPIGENSEGKTTCKDFEHNYQLGNTGYYYNSLPLIKGQTVLYTSDFGTEKAISVGPYYSHDFNNDGQFDKWSTDALGRIDWNIKHIYSFYDDTNTQYFYDGTIDQGTIIFASEYASTAAANLSQKISNDIVDGTRVEWGTTSAGEIYWIEAHKNYVTSTTGAVYWYDASELTEGIIIYPSEFATTTAASVEFTVDDKTYKTDTNGALSWYDHLNSIADDQGNTYWYDDDLISGTTKLYTGQYLNILAVSVPLVTDQDLDGDETFNEAWYTNNAGVIFIIKAHLYSFLAGNTTWWYDTPELIDNETIIYQDKYSSTAASSVGPFYDYDFNDDTFNDEWTTSSSGVLSIAPYHQYQLGSLNYWCDTFPVVQSETIIYNAQYSKTPAINKSNEIADCDGDIFEDRFSTNDFGVITYEKGHESQLSNYWYDGTLTQGVTIIYGTRFTTEPLKNHGPILDDYDFNDDGHKDLWGTDADGYVYWLLNRPYKFSIYWYDIGEDSEQIELGQTVLYATQYSNDPIGETQFLYKGINYSVNANGIIDIIIPPPSEPPPE